MAAQRELIPSVSAKELEHYKRVREQFEATDKKNGGKGIEEANGTIAHPGTPEWHAAHRPKSHARVRSKGKGKGKAREGMEDEDEESFYGEEPDESTTMTTNGAATPYGVTGRAGGNGFHNGDIDDDKGLY